MSSPAGRGRRLARLPTRLPQRAAGERTRGGSASAAFSAREDRRPTRPLALGPDQNRPGPGGAAAVQSATAFSGGGRAPSPCGAGVGAPSAFPCRTVAGARVDSPDGVPPVWESARPRRPAGAPAGHAAAGVLPGDAAESYRFASMAHERVGSARNGIHNTMDPDATQVLTWTGEFVSQENPVPPWESEARSRLAAALDHFTKPLHDLLSRDANEGDTRILVTDILSDGLGYSKYDDLTTEYRTTGESVDYGLKNGDSLFAFVEVKRSGQALTSRSLRPARAAAAAEGVEWLLLTNGGEWHAYHLDPDETVSPELVLEIDLLGGSEPTAKVDALFHLCKQAVEHGRLEHLRRWRRALTGRPLADVVQSPAVVEAIRAEVRQRTGHLGHIGDIDDVLCALRERVVSPRLLS